MNDAKYCDNAGLEMKIKLVKETNKSGPDTMLRMTSMTWLSY